ncbi:unnamed protein product [Bursaphelenchus xylophilus]|uniref:(pine wood nematode) hypothetical protein n=1 Tax=Bursaphelenchus xylophilus TaxID=6326 RepID=A0A1I7RZ88_BURXY|nr:unnamed protein product [Bursaphelenchus xylophilus]CAG9106736.1 unnamed protein product [Bursaphelenchus xylophilus]
MRATVDSWCLMTLLVFNLFLIGETGVFRGALIKRQASEPPVADVFSPHRVEEKITKDTNRCNSESLEKLMMENIGDDVKQSKLRIMEAAEATLGGAFNVVCAHGDFSYITSTKLYCLTGNDAVKCYAFLSYASDSE